MSTANSERRPRRILLVDDNAASCRALAKVLEASAYEVTTVGTGNAALDLLQQGPPPDFLLTDLMLPDLDGREVARTAQGLEPRPYIALITGWTMESGLEDAERWGVDQVFLKPLRIEELLAKLNEISARGDSPGSGF